MLARRGGSGSLRSALLSLLDLLSSVYDAERPLLPREDHFLRQVMDVLSDNAAEMPSLSELARKIGVSPSSFSLQFKKRMGSSLPDFFNGTKVERAKSILRTADVSVTDAALQCGFHNLSHFHRVFKERIGVTPQAFRDAAKKTHSSCKITQDKTLLFDYTH